MARKWASFSEIQTIGHQSRFIPIITTFLSFLLFVIGLQNPYLVLMDFNVQGVQSHALSLGFDAISTYALPGGTKEVTQIIFLYPSIYLSK
jgi:hypothetical protein